MVFMEFSTRKLRSVREGVERAARSQIGYAGPAPTYSGKHLHTHLTLHFQTYDAAETYSQTFRNSEIKDSEGCEVIYSHKNRVDTRPPQVKRRGIAMSLVYAALKAALEPGEKLEQAHEGNDGERFALFYSVNETTNNVRELVQAHWSDDGTHVRVDRFVDWHPSVPETIRTKVAQAAGL